MNWLEKTPRQIVNSLGDYEGGKINLTDEAVERFRSKSPFVGVGRVLGQGDWAASTSEYGSATMVVNDDWVVKSPMGKRVTEVSIHDELPWNKERVSALKEVSPETSFVVADNGYGAQIMTVQKRVKGARPLCDVAVRELLGDEQRVSRILEIADVVLEDSRKAGSYDLSGLHRRGRIVKRLTNTCPIYSDNVLMDKNGEVFLVDNVPRVLNKYKETLRGRGAKAYCYLMSNMWSLAIKIMAKFAERSVKKPILEAENVL